MSPKTTMQAEQRMIWLDGAGPDRLAVCGRDTGIGGAYFSTGSAKG